MSSNALSIARQFVRAPSSTGAISPASTQLVDKMVSAATVSQQKLVVELGPGTGVVTEAIAANLAPDAEFFAMELNAVFAEKTRQRCPDVKVFVDNALNLQDRLADLGHSNCDCILSSLPWTMFDQQLQKQLLTVIAGSLKPGGTFVTYAYLGGRLHPAGRRFIRLINDAFDDIYCSNVIWQNLPPARIYTCRT